MAGQAAADEVDFVEGVLGEEQFLAAGAGFEDVHGGVDIAFGDLAVEDEFHVTGALELHEDRLIGAGVRLDKGGGEDGEGSCLAGVAGSGEEAARHLEGADGDAAGSGGAATAAFSAAHVAVVGAGEAGDGIHEQEDMLAGLDEPFRAFDGELCDAAMVAHGLVVGGGIDLRAGEGAAELGDLLGALIDEKDHEMDLLVVFFADRLRHVEEQGGLAGAGR